MQYKVDLEELLRRVTPFKEVNEHIQLNCCVSGA